MPSFSYTALSADGHNRSGTVDADDVVRVRAWSATRMVEEQEQLYRALIDGRAHDLAAAARR